MLSFACMQKELPEGIERASKVRLHFKSGKKRTLPVFEYWPNTALYKDVLVLCGVRKGEPDVWWLPDSRIEKIEVLERREGDMPLGHPEVGYVIVGIDEEPPMFKEFPDGIAD